jgi:16S rRNA (adenine1518-N6/adenine1519-N6)-dimethyltransferase
VPEPTLKELKRALRDASFKPSKSRGQNFLFDHGTLGAIANDAGITPQDTVLEVGCGCGFLTAHLARLAGRVLAVEIDPVLAAVSRRFLASWGNIEVFTADILKGAAVNPDVLKKLRDTGGCEVVIGNLPYSAATAIISALSDWEFKPRALVLLLQEEVAGRLAAGPGEAGRGALSVISQAAFKINLLRRIGPGVFWPKPRVHSRLVRLEPRRVTSEFSDFRRFVFALFAQPRKTAVNSLSLGVVRSGLLQSENSAEVREKIADMVASLGIDNTARPGQLSESQIEAVFRRFLTEIPD